MPVYFRLTGKRRGAALVAAMMVIAMLLAVVIAIHYFQGTARRTYMFEEASLRYREGYRFALRQQILGIAPPSGLLVTASPTNTTSANATQIPVQAAKNIFDRGSLPDLRALSDGPAHSYFKYTPTTPDLGLRVFGSNTFTMVLTQMPGYAAYAPNGNIKITNIEGWANPTFEDTRATAEAYSGVKTLLGARTDITVANATYVEGHVREGDAKFSLGEGVGFKAPQLPMREYAGELFTQFKDARDQLKSNAGSGDKTNSLVSPSTGPGAIIDLFFGGGTGLEQFLSLRNANHFWFPMIPSFSPSPPYLYQFAFHLPYPPDNANYSSGEGVAEQLDKIGQDLAKAGKELEEAKKALDKAKDDFQNDGNASNLQKLNEAQAAYNGAEAKVNDLTQQMNAVSGPQTAQINAQMGAGMRGVPPTRAQDPEDSKGITGWNYSKAGTLLGSLVSFLFSFDPKNLADMVANTDVKLVHFGGKDREFKFNLDESHMVVDATTTVPRGRTLRLQSAGTITIAGDLWLQRGSTFVADCNKLEIVPGRGSNPSKFFSPSGRIYMEQGATLICSGDIECIGSSQWGSVVVGGIAGKINPITAGIFGRNVRLSGGVYAGTALDDLVEGLGLDVPALKDVNDHLLRPLIANIGPNAAKAAGPFWARKPYFAKYATTFQIICPPIPPFGVPGPPIPTPIPLPTKNVLVPVAQGLAYVYSVTLNMSLGENFYTHCDWWIFGEGVVPMVPQLDPKKVPEAIASFGSSTLDALNPETIIKDFIEAAVKDMISYVVAEVVQAVVKEVALKVIPYAGLVSMATDLIADTVSNLTNREGKRKSAGDSLTSALTASLASAGQNTLDSLASKFNLSNLDQFLREYNGVLVFAEDTLSVGGRNATGMFVARNQLNMTAQTCVGTLLSLDGNIDCQNLLYYPYFNRASFYVPKATASGWLERALQFQYDSAFASGNAVDAGPPAVPARITAQGWNQ